jgi:hypothetical protein
MPMSSPALNEIEALLEHLTREEQLRLIEEIAGRLRQTETRQQQSLFGIWRDKFPEDVDIDEALKEIREGGKPRCYS